MPDPIPLPSNRSFGTVFIVFFTLIGAFSWWRGGDWYPWLFGMSGIVLAVTVVIPDALTPFNKAWMKLAEILHGIVSPIVLGVIFHGVFTPVALGMRLAGRDAMKRKFEPQSKSYWVERVPPGPDAADLPNQF